MSKIYAMSDLHGNLDAFDYALSLIDLAEEDTKLVLCGDYIHGPDSYGVLNRIMELENTYGKEKVIALMGNHEYMATLQWPINSNHIDYDRDGKYLDWIYDLPLYYTEGNTIFVHAGIDEESGEDWEIGTPEIYFLEKYPAETGKIEGLDMKVVAGHVGTHEIAGDPHFHDIYYDSESHYYIDGTVLDSGIIPVLMVDTRTDRYYSVTESGARLILPYDEIEEY